MSDEPELPPSPIPARPRRLNPLGAFSIIPGLIASSVATFLFVDSLKPNRPPVNTTIDAAAGAAIYLGMGLIVLFSGGIGGLAALFGLVRRPRWQGLLGLVLSIGVPVALVLVSQYR